MSLRDSLKPAIKCKLCAFLATDPVLKAEWMEELAQPVTVVSHARVVKYLAQRYNVVLDEASVRRHRSKHAA